MERDKSGGAGIRRRDLAAGLAALTAVACGSSSIPSSSETASPVPTVSIVDQLMLVQLDQANRRMVQLETTYSNTNVDQIPANDLQEYIRSTAQVYSLVGVGGRIAYINFVLATQVVDNAQYAVLFSGEQPQLKPKNDILNTLAVVVGEQGPKIYVNKNAYAFTVEGSKELTPAATPLRQLGVHLGAGYAVIAAEFARLR